MASKNVFISMGTPYSESQAQFLDVLIEFLRDNAIEPRVINKTDYPTGNPLKDIARVLRECDGAIIVAYERTYFESGLEKRKSPIGSVRYTTPWNQIEASMAFVLNLPILVLVEEGLREEGLLEPKYDWYVVRTDISEAALANKEIRARLLAWCRKVQSEKRQMPIDRIGDEIPIVDFFKMLSVKMYLVLLAAVATVYAAGAASPLVTELFGKWLRRHAG